MSKETRCINGKAWSGDSEALGALERLQRQAAERKASIPLETIAAALNQVAACLRNHDGTHSSVQLRRFLWSLWNGHHYVNLYNLGNVLDDVNSDAVATIFTAYMRGILTEDHLRSALEISGEMKRWNRAEAEAPAGKPVDYPPMAHSQRELALKLGPMEGA